MSPPYLVQLVQFTLVFVETTRVNLPLFSHVELRMTNEKGRCLEVVDVEINAGGNYELYRMPEYVVQIFDSGTTCLSKDASYLLLDIWNDVLRLCSYKDCEFVSSS